MESNWKEAVFAIVERYKGKPVTLSEIYSRIRSNPIVTSYHLAPWKEGGQPRYQCWTRRRLTDLVKESRVKRVSTGTYAVR